MAAGVTTPAITPNVTQSTSDDPLEITILDVGHGNSALVRDGKQCAVIDAEPGTMVIDELESIKCDHIEHLIFSHSDKDHAGGGPTLLLDPARTIGTVWFNVDSEKETKVWERLLYAVWTRQRKGGLGGHQLIHTEIDRTLTCGRARLEICHPSILMAGTGPKRTSSFGRLSTNTVSVVIRVHLDKRPAALLAADMDRIALDHIRDNEWDLKAPVLVFPHHGGRPGRDDPLDFARLITRLVSPDLVIFSIKNAKRPANPHPQIVQAGPRRVCELISLMRYARLGTGRGCAGDRRCGGVGRRRG
ncbi:ComEC/Rec2 family competence protein [Planomonospora algeriensis]